EAAHEDGVTGGGVAVLAGIEGADAGGVAQRLGQGGGGLLVEQVLADHLHRAGGVHQRLVELGGGPLAGIGHHLLAVDLDLIEGGRGAAAVGRGDTLIREGGGAGHHQAGEQGGGEGTGGRIGRRSVLAGLYEGHGTSVLAAGESAPGRGVPAFKHG